MLQHLSSRSHAACYRVLQCIVVLCNALQCVAAVTGNIYIYIYTPIGIVYILVHIYIYAYCIYIATSIKMHMYMDRRSSLQVKHEF